MRTITRIDPLAIMAFVQVVDVGSFRGASMALGIPKSTLSQRVAALEEQLGAQLLVRTTRSVTLTDVGLAYHREVAPALAALRSAESIARRTDEATTGRVRLTAPYELGQRRFGALLAEFGARHPGVSLEVDLLDRQVDLIDEGYDLAIRIGPLTDARLVGRRIGKPVHIGLYASPAYLLAAGTPTSPRQLARHRCLVMHGAHTPLRWSFSAKQRARSVAVTPHVSVNSFVVLRQLALAGVGIARLPAMLVEEEVLSRKLVEVLRDEAPPPVGTFVVYPAARGLTAAARALLDLLAVSFEATPALF